MNTDRRPTKIKAHIPKLKGDGYAIEVWERGRNRLNPASGYDKVTDITLWPDQFGKVRAEVEYESFGAEWVLDYIVFVEFRKDVQAGDKVQGEGDI